MTTKKEYAQEMFERRLERYRQRPRTKLPHQAAGESCRRAGWPPAGGTPLALSAAAVLRPSGDNIGRDPHCLPFDLFDTRIQYDAVSGHAVLRGRCGTIVLDDTVCMVDLARFFITRLQEQSCGECTMCRIGTMRLREMLERICAGVGSPDALDSLELLAEQVGSASRCEIGRQAAQAVLSSLDAGRASYEQHLRAAVCPQGVCRGNPEPALSAGNTRPLAVSDTTG
jgi:hypothetical protein